MTQGVLEKKLTTAFSKYGDAIFRFCLLKTADPQAAASITRATFVYYWQCLRDERRMVNRHILLYSKANELTNDWCKRGSEALKWHFEPESLAGKQAILDSVTAYQEVLRPVNEMEETDKEVLLLTHVSKLKPREIGILLDETPTTVTARLERAMSHLRKKICV